MLQIWTDKSLKLKEMVCGIRDFVSCFTDITYLDTSANCRSREYGNGNIGNGDKAERARQIWFMCNKNKNNKNEL